VKATQVLAAVTAVALAVVLINIGYSFTGDARTYNEGNANDSRFITISLGDTQYSSAVTSEMTYHTEILIDSEGRTVMHIPEHETTITVNAVTYDVTEVVQFDISLGKQGSDPMPTYSLSVSVDDTDKMNGTFFVSYWTDPSNDATRVNAAFPGSIQIDDLTTQSIKFCLYVHAETTADEPEPPLDDIAFKFRATAEV